MPVLWLFAFFGLLVLSLAQFAVLYYLARQLGLLYLRINPAGARVVNVGPDIGSPAPAFAVQTVEGIPLASVSNDDRQTMLLFISLSCSTCSSLLYGLRTVAKGEKDVVRFVVVMRDDPARRDYTGDLPELAALKTHVSIVLSSSLFEQYSITGTPYAVLLTSAGVVANKGIVNDISHIESLIPEPTRKDIYAT